MLTQLGLEFTTMVADIEEVPRAGECGIDYVQRLAREKAQTVQNRLSLSERSRSVIIGADTVVVARQQVLEKPNSFAHACEMWRSLSDSAHRVISGVAVCHEDEVATQAVSTKVFMHTIDTAQMHRYWQTGEPADKAGGYAIQGRAAAWVKHIEGSASNSASVMPRLA